MVSKIPDSICRNSHFIVVKHTEFKLYSCKIHHYLVFSFNYFINYQLCFGKNKGLIHCVRCENNQRGTGGRSEGLFKLMQS